MDRQDRSADSMTYIMLALKRTMGKKSRAWAVWWELYGPPPVDCGVLPHMHGSLAEWQHERASALHTACLAALLSLGAPPHPDYLTTDTSKAIPSPPKRSAGYNRWLAEEERKMKRQWPWNRRFNEWAITHQLHGEHSTHGPAQFRKFFGGWLHACKEIDDDRARQQVLR